MDMKEVFCPDYVKTGYLAVDKKSLLHEMAVFLQENHVVNSSEDFFQAVWEREMIMSTGVGRAVALPHGNHSTVQKLNVTVWQLAEPIEYEAIDEKPVQIIFLVAVPPIKQDNYMKILAAISNFIRIPGNVDTMLNASNKEELFNLLLKIKL